MRFVHWGILMLLVLVVPFLLGMVPTSYMKEHHKTPAYVFLCGWLVMFSSFEVVAIPFIILKKSYSVLIMLYSGVILLLLILSCFSGRTMWKKLYHRYRFMALKHRINQQGYKVIYLLGWFLFFAVVMAQVYMAVFYEYYDGDDSYYLAVPLMSDKFDSMYLRDPYTGYNYNLDIRHALSPTPLFIGWLSKASGIHPTIISHSVLSVVWLLLMYLVYSELSKYLFRKLEQYRPWFLVLLSIWYLFGNVTISTAETFIMTRTWQGKGLLAGVLIPCVFLCFFLFTEKEVSKGSWIFFIMVCISSVFATSVSFMLITTMAGLAVIFIGIYRSKAKRRSLCRK